MRDFIRSWWFLLVILLLVAGVIVALVYGIATHTEPGLMQSTPGFTREDVPLVVCPGGYVPDIGGTEQAYRATETAVRTTNLRLGFSALRMTDNSAPCAIRVLVGVPAEHGVAGAEVDPGGAANFRAGMRACEITTTNTGTDEMLDLVLQHELGHCLGLDHDCWAGSIMCGGSCCTLAPTPDGSYPPRIDDSDRELLRHLFGHE